jgi:hypothetical protein
MIESPIYPGGGFYKVSECGIKPLRDLERWVKGSKFHQYGVDVWEMFDTYKEALEMISDMPGKLEIKGELLDYRNQIQYWISYRQAGNPDMYGFSGPHSSPENAAYMCLSLIEEEERKIYEENLVIGIA